MRLVLDTNVVASAMLWSGLEADAVDCAFEAAEIRELRAGGAGISVTDAFKGLPCSIARGRRAPNLGCSQNPWYFE